MAKSEERHYGFEAEVSDDSKTIIFKVTCDREMTLSDLLDALEAYLDEMSDAQKERDEADVQ